MDKPDALRLADELDAEIRRTVQLDMLHHNAAAELRRLYGYKLPNKVWDEKTNWVQETAQPKELGMHRADVLQRRIDRLTAQRDALLAALKEMLSVWEEDPAYGSQHADKAHAAIKAAEEWK